MGFLVSVCFFVLLLYDFAFYAIMPDTHYRFYFYQYHGASSANCFILYVDSRYLGNGDD